MATISSHEASVLSIIKNFAERGTPKEDLQPFIDKLQTKRAKKLADAYINPSMQKATRAPKVHKTRQRILRTQPLRIQPTLINGRVPGYYDLAREYKQKTGKHFKRNGWEMRQRMTKIDALKRRLDQLNQGETTQDTEKKNSPEFQLGGAL